MSFDTLAPHYRWMEAILAGPLLQHCRTRHLRELETSSRILVLGPGRGRFVTSLLAMAPRMHLTLVDSSAGMLRRIERVVRAPGDQLRVELVHADIRTWAPDTPEFDAVASHFFLDCFAPDELSAVVAKVAGWLAPGGAWLISDFRVPERGWRRHRARAIHAAMYTVFRRVTSISARSWSPPDAWLERAGLELASREILNHGLLHTDVWRRRQDP